MKAPVRAKSDTHLRSLLKAVSWRCVGTMDTFIVSFVVLNLTGAASGAGHAARISGSIAGVEVLTKIALYYFHERAWGRISLGAAAKTDAVPAPATESVS